MLDGQGKQFLQSFTDAAHCLNINPEIKAQALNALSDLWPIYAERAANAVTLAPFFADHGKDHPVRLAAKCTELFKSEFIAKSPCPTYLDVRSLVLAFASFMFHDIGMCIPPSGSTVLEELAVSQRVRADHDERSLEFIENEFIKNHTRFSRWNSFWLNQDCVGLMPIPAGRIAFVVLARICKSHGDDEATWLQDESLDTYRFRTTGELTDFQEMWNEDWVAFSPIVYAAATILCLCDLCDIDPYRYSKLPADMNFVLPQNLTARKWSLIHYISHQVAKVKFSKTLVEIELKGQTNKIWSVIAVQYCGAVNDLLLWGKKKALVRRVREFLNPDFADVVTRKTVNDDESWKNVTSFVESDGFRSCFKFIELNKKLEPSLDTETYFLALTMLGIERSIQRDLKEFTGGAEADLYSSVLMMIKEGLLIDSAVNLKIATSDKHRIFDIALPEEDRYQEAKVSRFIAGLRLVRQLIALKQKYMGVRLVSFSSQLMANIRVGNYDGLKDAILLLEVRDEQTNDHEAYQQITKFESQLTANNIYVIFIGNGFLNNFGESPENAAQISGSYNQSIIDLLISNPANLIRTSLPPTVDIVDAGPQGPVELTSPGQAVATLWIRGAGYLEFVSQVKRELLDTNSPRALSILALLTISECLATRTSANDPKVTISIDQLEKEYCRFQARFPEDKFASIDSVLKRLPTEFVDLPGRVVALPSTILNTFAPSKFPRNEHNWFQILVGAVMLQSEGYFNPSANVLHANTISSAHAGKFLELLKEAGDLTDEARVIIGTAFGEFLGRQVCRDRLRFSWITSLFKPSKFSHALEQCLYFQIVYRVARRFIDEGGSVSAEDIPTSPVARLGLLEAICRNSEETQSFDARSEAAINHILEKTPTSDRELERMVVFDILWKYCKDFYRDYVKLTEFVESCRALNWDQAADVFHKQSNANISSILMPKDYKKINKWLKFRETFHFVLTNTPTDLSRSLT